MFWYTMTLLVGFGLGFLLAALLAASTRGTIRDSVVGDWPSFSNPPTMRADGAVPGAFDGSPARAKAAEAWFSVPGPR